MRRAVFLDLSGTLTESVRPGSTAGLVPLPGVLTALAVLAESEFLCPVVSNQSRIALGQFTETAFRGWFADFARRVGDHGGRLDGLYLCPHRPDQRCRCRKPKTFLHERAVALLGIDVARSWVVGDRRCDMEAGSRLGARPLLVLTGNGHIARHDPVRWEAAVPDVLAAAQYIVNRA